MTEKQLAILAGLGLSVICVFFGLAFCLMGGAVPSLQPPTLQFDYTTPIHQVATEAPDVPVSIPNPGPIDALEPKNLEELTPPAPLPEKLTPPAPLPEELPPRDLENLYTPLPGE